MPDERAATMLGDAALDNYRHYLESARRYRPHVLTEPEEKIMVEKSVTARSAWDRLFEEATTAVKVTDGEEEISLDVALSRLHVPDQERRRQIAEAITDALRVDLRTRRYILNTVLADKAIDDRLRNFPSWISERNLANEASDESVEALVEAVTSRYDITHRYYALKKQLLGLDPFHDWDRYAPLGEPEPAVSWEEARETVLDAYGSFSPRMRELAAEFFDGTGSTRALAPNKRGGAFAHPATPSAHPYVMLNFTGKRRDVLVLAHELGHGVHMSLSRAQTQLNFDTPLTTAETASIFGETVTFSRLLEAETDPERRLSLMVGRIDDAIATIFRQVAMNRFEDAIHTQRRASGELSERGHRWPAWLKTQREMLGPAVEVTENYGIWWSYVHHFIAVPGYVYAYAFGNLLALAIYQRALEEGPGFAPKYFELLAAGGSASPEELTSKIGVDLADPGFLARGAGPVSALGRRGRGAQPPSSSGRGPPSDRACDRSQGCKHLQPGLLVDRHQDHHRHRAAGVDETPQRGLDLLRGAQGAGLVDQFVGDGGGGTGFVAGEVEVLDLPGLLDVAVTLDQLVVEVAFPGAHAPDVKGHVGAGHLAADVEVVVHDHRHGRRDLEILELATRFRQPRLQVRLEHVHVAGGEERGHPAVGDLAGHLEVLGAEGGDDDRDLAADRVVDQLQAHVELDRLAVVDDALAAQRHADHVDVLAGALQRLLEGHAVPALDHLRAAGAEPEDEAAPAEHVEGAGALREQRGRAREDVEDAGADLDPSVLTASAAMMLTAS